MGARTPAALACPRLSSLALACLAPRDLPAEAAAEALWLGELRLLHGIAVLDPARAVADWLAAPPAADATLALLAGRLALGTAELLAVSLALAADTDVMAGRALAWLQAPHREPWPTVGLVTCLAGLLGEDSSQALAGLLDGPALASGLLKLESRGRALPDAALCMPLPLVLAATQGVGRWPGVDHQVPALQLPPSQRDAAQAQARSLGPAGCLVVASGHAVESRAAAAVIAQALGQEPVFIQATPQDGVLHGLGPWLALRQAIPVFCGACAPGERRRLVRPVGHAGVMLVASGPDGAWEHEGDTVPMWRVPVPPRDERAALWRACGLDDAAAEALARQHRHAGARIHALGELAQAQRRAEGAGPLQAGHVVHAARTARATDLGTLAQALCDDVDDAALVLPLPLRRELEALARRCEARDGLADDLGPAARTRYRPGVRALFVGPSGTGKTLSASWLATRLGMPLYRVDVAAVSSKYIGETEKNLGDLFARAEHAEVMLLFDEADALFGRRTEVRDANDRYANQQTNYLLQRIESFEGIVLLTSNSRSRFDAAFTRRLDSILEFPAPSAEERRALWLAHLGGAHALSAADLSRLAAGCDLAGGHIRNVVLAARALSGAEPIQRAELGQALAAEFRKLGRPLPAGVVER
ncbi:MAG TPA: ATP-binding protein [Burkholderiaceae bacterium]|nr:ATP-binding protein [Burkholderiaceae bacterium]